MLNFPKVPIFAKRGTLIFSIYIGWADFFLIEIFNFNIFWGFSTIFFFIILGVVDFCGYCLGVTSKLLIFMGYLLKLTTVICVL